MHGKEDRKRNRTSGISDRGRARSPAIINPDRCRWGGWQFDGSFLFIKIQRYIKRREGRREGGNARTGALWEMCPIEAAVAHRQVRRPYKVKRQYRVGSHSLARDSLVPRPSLLRARSYYVRLRAREKRARALGVGGGFVFRCVSTEIERRVPGR